MIKWESLVPAPDKAIMDAKKAFQDYLIRVKELKEEIDKLEIKTEEDLKVATEIGMRAYRTEKEIEKKRDELILEPMLYVNSVKNFVKVLTEDLKQIVKISKDKASVYLIFKKKKEEEEKERLERERQELQKKLNEEVQRLGLPPIEIPEFETSEPKAVRTSEGTGYIKEVWTFEIEDSQYIQKLIDSLPNGDEKIAQLKEISPYLIFDEKKIRKAVVSGGVRKIPGIKIFKQETMVYRR